MIKKIVFSRTGEKRIKAFSLEKTVHVI